MHQKFLRNQKELHSASTEWETKYKPNQTQNNTKPNKQKRTHTDHTNKHMARTGSSTLSAPLARPPSRTCRQSENHTLHRLGIHLSYVCVTIPVICSHLNCRTIAMQLQCSPGHDRAATVHSGSGGLKRIEVKFDAQAANFAGLIVALRPPLGGLGGGAPQNGAGCFGSGNHPTRGNDSTSI